jgi:arylsulfatase A-like enzyme
MKQIAFLCTALLCSFASAADRPNIVLIFIDDMGWTDTGYNGSDLYETPHIDALAASGMTFTNAYAAAGNCEPSRACLISGQYTPRHHMYAVSSTNRGPKNEMRVKPIPNINSLPVENVTVADALQQAGYATAMFGKWHLGKQSPHLPSDQGFGDGDMMSPPSPTQFAKTGDPKNIFRINNGACQFMEAHKDGPFFVYIAHHATHMGIQAKPETHEHFDKKGPGKQHQNTKFAAMNADMDTGVGIVLAKIKSLGIEDNTAVFFTSDNGGLPQSPQTPLRGFKGMYYEGGIRVPMIARLPGKVSAGSQSSAPVVNIDLYPTFLALAGAAAPQGKVLDGESLVPVLTGSGPLNRKSVYWHFPGYLNGPNPGSRDPIFRTRPVTVIRKGDWKLHLFHEEWSLDGGRDSVDTNNSVELYNLANDIGEQSNLASRNKKMRDELLGELLAWKESTNAKFAHEANASYGSPDAAKERKRRKSK